ncbi:MAG: hypothetical protein UY04_C0051G0005 [Parcubacteria group bacterium GW2011_GWA2_47_7]|nr:MAG: hypothetical protein UY04_C0051G0005 [Parcubacteria group bacterium GW2011_GWA2_47_7]
MIVPESRGSGDKRLIRCCEGALRCRCHREHCSLYVNAAIELQLNPGTESFIVPPADDAVIRSRVRISVGLVRTIATYIAETPKSPQD